MSIDYLPQATDTKKNYPYLAGFFLWGLSVLLLLQAGALAVLCLGLLLAAVLAAPMLVNRYRLFLFLWIFVSPAFDNWRTFLIAGANPVIILITGLTIPVAMVMIGRNTKKILSHLPFVGCLMLFNLVLILNLFWPDAEQGGLLECLKMFIEVFIIVCGYCVIRAGQAPELFKGVNLFIILNCLVAFFQRMTGLGMMNVEGIPRVGGLVGHPNCLAFLIVLYIPFGIYRVMHAENRRDRSFWISGIILGVAALLLTMCKNAIFTLGFEMLILACFLPTRLKIRLAASGLACLAALIASDLVFHLDLLNHLTDRFNNTDSWEWRLRIWSYLLGAMDFPSLLFGHGTNASSALIRLVSPRSSDHVHNAYLQIFYDYGLTGLSLMFAFLIPFCRFAAEYFRSRQEDRLNHILPLLILSAIFINMSSDNSIFLRTPMTFAWLFVLYFYLRKGLVA